MTIMKVFNRANKLHQAESRSSIHLDFISKLAEMMISMNGKIWKEIQWPFWSYWTGLSNAAKQLYLLGFYIKKS